MMAMSVQPPLAQGGVLPSQPITESRGWSAPGVPVLVAGVVATLAGAGLLALGIALKDGAVTTTLAVLGILLLLASGLDYCGLTPVTAGHARVVQLFRRHRGPLP